MNDWRTILDTLAYIGWVIWGITILVFAGWVVIVLTVGKFRTARKQTTIDKGLRRILNEASRNRKTD